MSGSVMCIYNGLNQRHLLICDLKILINDLVILIIFIAYFFWLTIILFDCNNGNKKLLCYFISTQSLTLCLDLKV
jgi:hypothetical protein